MINSDSFKCLPWFVAAGVGVFCRVQAEMPVDFAEFEVLLQQHCISCHSGAKPKGSFDLEKWGNELLLRGDWDVLENMMWSLEENEMPPEKAEHPLPQAGRQTMINWLNQAMFDLENSRPNDPGRVVMPRLNHHEFKFVLTDLLGIEIDTSDLYPFSGGGSSGFSNDGESMTTDVLEVEQMLSAAKGILRHARFTPAELRWSETGTDRNLTPEQLQEELVNLWGDELAHAYHMVMGRHSEYKNRSVASKLYEEMDMMAGAYLEAAWRYRYRAELGEPDADLHAVSAAYPIPLAPAALRKWVRILQDPQLDRGVYLQSLVDTWTQLPGPDQIDPKELRAVCKQLDERLDQVTRMNHFGGWYAQSNDAIERTHKLSRNAQKEVEKDLETHGRYTALIDRSRDKSGRDSFRILVSPAGLVQQASVVELSNFASWDNLALDGGKDWQPEVEVISGQARQEGDAWLVKPPAVLQVKYPENGKARIQAQMHPELGKTGAAQVRFSQQQEETAPTYLPGRMLLAHPESAEGVRLRESAEIAGRVLTGQSWGLTDLQVPRSNQVEEGGHFRPVLKKEMQPRPLEPHMLTPDEILWGLYPDQRERFVLIEKRLADACRTYALTEQQQRGEHFLREFSTQAWRGFGDEEDVQPLLAMMNTQLQEGKSFQQSMRGPVMAVLLHPKFLYRIQESRMTDDSYAIAPLEMASRLSFLLWGSMPDNQLLAAAQNGELNSEEGLLQQTRRMLHDAKASRMEETFAGYWLHLQSFEQHEAVDKTKFPEFTPELRQDMAREVETLLQYVLSGQAPVTDVVDADYVFVNERLAAHYGIDGVKGSEIRKVELPENNPRGGLLTTGALLTKTSKPLRTSPVVRGDWVLQEMLGAHMPPPPDDVGLLSDDPVNEEGQTILQQLEIHRENPSCSSCHNRMDPIGIALESFDPIGRWREKDASGNSVLHQVALPDGTSFYGVMDLKAYLRANEDDFLRHLVEKFTAYGLGRKVLATDQDLLAKMERRLRESDYRFAALVEVLVTSEQFRMRRDELRDPALSSNQSF